MGGRRSTLGLAAVCLVASCDDRTQSALDPRGIVAESILDLFWLFTAICVAVWVLVVIGLVVAAFRRRPAAERALDPLTVDIRRDHLARQIVVVAVAVSLAIIVALTAASYLTGKGLAGISEGPLTIRVTGHQWWWELRYESDDPSQILTTANEIHIPVGEPVLIKLESRDVIHSFWVPNLAGKRDLIPGRPTSLILRAEEPGIYRGQCAEFCGLQHAHMAITVVAEPREQFERWMAAQSAAAPEPQDEEAKQGRALFLSQACVMCHTVRGTPAAGKVAPDLTHIASRRLLAAGALPMSRGSLAAWLADPQGIKPGSNMPRVDLDADQLNALVSYLEGLQ